EALQPRRDPSYSPLAQAMFVLHNTPRPLVQLPELTLSPLPTERLEVQYDLLLRAGESDAGVSAILEYNTDLFDGVTITRMVGHFQALLESIVADPDRPLSTVSLLTPPELQQLLGEWNKTAIAYPQSQCLQQLFEAHASRQPEA